MFSPESGFLELYVDERIHQSETLWMTLRASDPKVRTLSEDMELELSGRRYRIHEITKGRSGAEATVIVEAPALWTTLADTRHIGTLAFAANDLIDVLTFVVETVTDWTVAVASPADPLRDVSLEANDASVLDILRKIAKITGYELEFNTGDRIVRMVDATGTARGLGFTYGHNLVEVERRSNPPLVTRLYPFGKDRLGIELAEPDNLPYVEDLSFYTAQGLDEATARARYTKVEVWQDESFITAADLYEAALARLADISSATVNYRMSVLDLSSLTGSSSDDYRLGDTVLVTDDELHFKNIRVRVVRIERHPLEPWNSQIELSYLPVVAPDPDVSGGRTSTSANWELFASRNRDTPRYIGAIRTVLNRLNVNVIDGAEWIVGYALNATVRTSGTVTFEALDVATSTAIAPTQTFDVTAGDPFHWGFTFGDKEVEAGQYNLVVRAEGNSGAELDIDPDGTAFYVLARGTTQADLTLPDSIRFDYTGAIQEFTVPDDVSSITIECHAAEGGQKGTGSPTPALGGMLTATFDVSPGQIYDVYVGGWSSDNLGQSVLGGWPDGGDTHGAAQGAGGGGSSQVRPDGGAITTALLIAGGGGGRGSADIVAFGDIAGGGGGWPEGIEAPGVTDADGANSGGTQTTGGDGAGTTAFGDGAQGAGGDTVSDSESPGEWVGSPTTTGGGGGGGWYGGGGGGFGRGARGGGGGSGFVGDGAYDLTVENNENAGPGYVIISWTNPV